MPPVGFFGRGVLRGPHTVFAEHGFPDALGHPFPVLDSYDVAHVFGFLGVSLSAQPQESVGIVRQRSHVTKGTALASMMRRPLMSFKGMPF